MVTLANPHLGTNTEAGWAMGFSWGFVGPAFSSQPPLIIAEDQLAAFNEGVLAGQQAAIEGLDAGVSCVSLEQAVSPAAEGFVSGVHKFELIGLVRAVGHFAHFTAEALVFAFLLMIPGPPPLEPISTFGSIADRVRGRLVELGLVGRVLFLAAGIDEEASGCELQFTAIFTSLEAARNAAQAMQRPHWVLARWDAAAPMSGGGFQVVESDMG